MISKETKLTQHPRTASRVIDGKAVVIVIDSQALHTLNEVGTFVWERSDGRELGRIAEELATEYDVSAEDAVRDVETFATQMVGLGALRIDP
jgi:hypothetical protein